MRILIGFAVTAVLLIVAVKLSDKEPKWLGNG